MFSLLNFITLSTWKKGEKNDIRHIKDDNNMYQQCLYIYDIVYLNGQVLTNLPLKERILKLREVVPHEISGAFIFFFQMIKHYIEQLLIKESYDLML